MGKGIKPNNEAPNTAPIKNNGVTSPPLKPALKIKLVNSIFSKKSNEPCWCIKASWITGSPRPVIFSCPESSIKAVKIKPPITGLKIGALIFEKRIENNFPV